MELADNELRLLAFFRRNARLALTKISKQTGVPVSTIFDKLRKYEGNIIQRHVALLDFQKLGYTTRANVFVKTTPDNRLALAQYLKLHPNVNAAYRVNNGYDYLIEAIFRNIQEHEDFLENLEIEHGVTNKEVYFVIGEVSREHFMAGTEVV